MRKCTGGKIIKKNYGGQSIYYARMNFIDLDDAGKALKYYQKDIRTDILATKKNFPAASAMIEEIAAEYNSDSCRALLEDYCEKWVKSKEGLVERTTYDGYVFRVARIRKYFRGRHLALADVAPQDIKDFYTWMASVEIQRGHKTSKGYSNRTLKDTAVLLSSILAEAADLDLIPRNPAAKVKIPQRPVDRVQRVYLSAEDVPEFRRAIKGHRLELLFLMALAYGMRREELLGLRWSAIRDGKLYVEHTVTEWTEITEKDRAKTEAGYRAYALIPELLEMLKKTKALQAYYRKELGREYYESPYVFTWEDGRTYRPDYVTKSFRKLVKRQDNALDPRLTLHSLRASCVSILIHAGTDVKDTQVFVGHADISTTLEIYARSNERQQDAVASVMSGVISCESSSPESAG